MFIEILSIDGDYIIVNTDQIFFIRMGCIVFSNNTIRVTHAEEDRIKKLLKVVEK